MERQTANSCKARQHKQGKETLDESANYSLRVQCNKLKDALHSKTNDVQDWSERYLLSMKEMEKGIAAFTDRLIHSDDEEKSQN